MSDRQKRLIEALKSPAAYPHATEAIRLVETHISFVLLTGEFAYKIKKAVELPFLDFSTLERREHFCHQELELNRRFAPELYLEVVPIGGEPGRPRVGATPAQEYAVRMRQFDAAATADHLLDAGALEATALTDFARRLARFHASLEPEDAPGSAAAMRENLDELADALGDEADRIAGVAAALGARLATLAPRLAARRRHGFVRECHGDLHLGNIARVDERLLPFDCLEFDRALRTIDIVDEMAFLFMDLAARDRRDLAFAFVDACVAESGDYAGLELLGLFAAHRALVRAKVAALAADGKGNAGSARNLRYAESALAPARPLLLLTTGLSGSGKTYVGRHLVPALGAVQIRSDVERKRLHGLAPDERPGDDVGAGLYAPAATEATYARLGEAAAAALAGGIDVIVDAACLERRRRQAFRDLAAQAGARFLLLACEAPEPVLRQRIGDRSAAGRDASDATLEVLEHQLESREAISGEEESRCLRLDTSQQLDVAGLKRRIDERR